MAKVIDVRQDGGEFVILGEALTLPSSDSGALNNPIDGSIRYNPALSGVEIAKDGEWERFVPNPVVRRKNDTDYTITDEDENNIIEFDNDAPVVINLSSNNIEVGAKIEIHQSGAGTITVVPNSNVTLLSRNSLNSLAGQESVAILRKMDDDVWRMYGDIA